MPTIKVHNVETGEVIEREMTAEEIAQNASVEIVEPTLEEKLANVGLNLDDLKTALGL